MDNSKINYIIEYSDTIVTDSPEYNNPIPTDKIYYKSSSLLLEKTNEDIIHMIKMAAIDYLISEELINYISEITTNFDNSTRNYCITFHMYTIENEHRMFSVKVKAIFSKTGINLDNDCNKIQAIADLISDDTTKLDINKIKEMANKLYS